MSPPIRSRMAPPAPTSRSNGTHVVRQAVESVTPASPANLIAKTEELEAAIQMLASISPCGQSTEADAAVQRWATIESRRLEVEACIAPLVDTSPGPAHEQLRRTLSCRPEGESSSPTVASSEDNSRAPATPRDQLRKAVAVPKNLR